MAISKETVEYMAHLARIELSPKELEKLAQQLQGILDFIDQLKKLEVKEVPPTSHILPLNNVFREDIRKESLSINEALKNAPDKQGNFFGVPKVIDES